MVDMAENNPPAYQLASRHGIRPEAADYIKKRLQQLP